MIYYGNPCGPAVVDAMTAGLLGLIDTPHQGSRDMVREAHAGGADWCADNGAFSDRWEAGHWWAWLQAQVPHADRCRFAVAPDVVGDAAATLERATPWLEPIRELGYSPAYVAQNGSEHTELPWGDLETLFLGGSLECLPCGYVYREPRKPARDELCPHCSRPLHEWKLGAAARGLVTEAKARGKWVHMGRVSSFKRLQYADAIGCDSADGTYLIFGPDKNLPTLLGWLAALRSQHALFA